MLTRIGNAVVTDPVGAGIVIIAMIVVIVWLAVTLREVPTKSYNRVTVVGSSTPALYLALILHQYGFKVTVRPPSGTEPIVETTATIGTGNAARRIDVGPKQYIPITYGLSEYLIAKDIAKAESETILAYPVHHVTDVAPNGGVDLHNMKGAVLESDMASLAEYGGMSKSLYNWLSDFEPPKTSLLDSYEMVNYIHGDLNGPATNVTMHRASTGVMLGSTMAWPDTYVGIHQSHDGMARMREHIIKRLNALKINYTPDVVVSDVAITSATEPPSVTYAGGGKAKSDDVNHVVIACDPTLMNTHPLMDIVNSNSTTRTHIYAVAFDVELAVVRAQFPSPIRKVILPFGPAPITIGVLYIKPMMNGRCGLVATGYAGNNDVATIETSVLNQLSVIGLVQGNILSSGIWPHNIRFTSNAIDNIIPRRVGQAQGQGGVWYAGELFSHSDTSSQLSFANTLAAAMTKKVRPTLPIV